MKYRYCYRRIRVEWGPEEKEKDLIFDLSDDSKVIRTNYSVWHDIHGFCNPKIIKTYKDLEIEYLEKIKE